MLEIRVDENLVLRTLALSDAEEMAQVITDNRAHLGEFLPWADRPWTVQDAREFIIKARTDCDQGSKSHAGIWHHGKLVGHVSLSSIAPKHKAEISGWLAVNATGQGLMSRAIRGMVEYAFTELKLVRVLLRCRTDNVKSAIMARRLGFRLEGQEIMSERRGDKFYDKYRFAIFARDWRHS